ncbi:hypothetical protein [Rhodococcus sp. H29-C3]|uniref:hypothetical protein n=1 Tax=Rhodococcus sp. H29-C3 TaxID=3046307 RepID=UPI0024BA30C9|nr:hypothetical protein [Rhodococcus sp. H29-C3]MDJ0362458.1 hypothetical protein [Rhodococcus sp. H29-C3]
MRPWSIFSENQFQDAMIGWTASSVSKIEQTQLAPAYELLESAFGAFNDAADTMTSRVMYSSFDS